MIYALFLLALTLVFAEKAIINPDHVIDGVDLTSLKLTQEDLDWINGLEGAERRRILDALGGLVGGLIGEAVGDKDLGQSIGQVVGTAGGLAMGVPPTGGGDGFQQLGGQVG